jgi:excinuclease ABC subunit B
VYEADYHDTPARAAERVDKKYKVEKLDDIPRLIADLRKQMVHHADLMEFEKAADLRDKIKELEAYELELR